MGILGLMTDTRPTPRLTPLAASLPASVPFVGPEAQERARGRPFAARLGANENVFGPSPAAIAAMREAAAGAWMYGDPESHDLRQALAAHHGVAPEAIMIGEGIDGLLGYLVRLLVGPGDTVVTSAGAYPTFNYHVTGFGGALSTVPYRADHEDPEALIARAAEQGAKLVYLANPDNPMASWHDAARVQAMIDAVPPGARWRRCRIRTGWRRPSRRWPMRAHGSVKLPRPTGCAPCLRPPISSRWTVVRMGVLPAPCWSS